MINLPIYGSTNVQPNGISIDSTISNNVTWTYNGSSPQTHYQCIVYLNSTNAIIHDSGKTASTNNYHTVSANTLTNGNTYKIQVTNWENLNTAKSQWVLFFCDALPTLTIGTLPTNVQQFLFTANYNSAQSIPVLTYEFTLYNSLSEQISTSGTIYPSVLTYNNTNPLSYLFDGLVSGESYKVKCTCINQRGIELTTGLQFFEILYSYPQSIPSLVVLPDNNTGSVNLNWVSLIQKLGYTFNQALSYVDGKFNKGLQLDQGNYLYYTEPIPSDFTLYFWVKIPLGYNGVLVKFGEDANGMQIGFDGNRFWWRMQEFQTCGRLVETLLPSDTLYPSNDLYPRGGIILGNFCLIGIQHSKVIIQGEYFEETLSI